MERQEAPAATAANAFEDEYSSENELLSQPVFHPPPPPSLPRRREDGAKRGQESSSTSETNLDSNKRRRESPPSNGTGKQGSARKARQESPNPANAKENNGTEPTFPVRHDRPSSVTAHSTHPTNKRKYTILPSFAKKKKKDATPYQKALRDDIVSAVNDLLSGSKIMAEDAMRKLHKMELQDIPKNEKLREMVIDAGALPAIFQAMTKFATNCEIQEIALALLSELGVVPGLLICEYGGIILTLKAMQLFPNQTDLQYNALHVLDNELNDGDGGVDERQQEIVSEFVQAGGIRLVSNAACKFWLDKQIQLWSCNVFQRLADYENPDINAQLMKMAMVPMFQACGFFNTDQELRNKFKKLFLKVF